MEECVGLAVSPRQQAKAPFKQGVSAVRLAGVSTYGNGPHLKQAEVTLSSHRKDALMPSRVPPSVDVFGQSST